MAPSHAAMETAHKGGDQSECTKATLSENTSLLSKLQQHDWQHAEKSMTKIREYGHGKMRVWPQLMQAGMEGAQT